VSLPKFENGYPEGSPGRGGKAFWLYMAAQKVRDGRINILNGILGDKFAFRGADMQAFGGPETAVCDFGIPPTFGYRYESAESGHFEGGGRAEVTRNVTTHG
jgi:hypothetical protein